MHEVVAKTAFAKIQLRNFIKRFKYDSNLFVLHGFQICFEWQNHEDNRRESWIILSTKAHKLYGIDATTLCY